MSAYPPPGHYFNRGAQTVERVCRNCGEAFRLLARRAKRPNRGVFCSRSCNNSAIAKRRNANQRGAMNPNWKGGVSADHMRYRRRFVAKSPEKVKAQAALQSAVSRGLIVPPASCSSCGVECKPHGHHDDYSKPLEVRWLCQGCHNRHHAAVRVAARSAR